MIPKPIYELLPYLYTAAGTWAALGLDPTAGRVSGLILVTAGFLIFSMRRNYRRVR